ncbi:DUF6423 family protein [Streptomyces sp. NBRC 110028]|uniref:DUF6423 family protein n=1 Tax=Streptomyces sp. NBRC 110028 TaxID=1621260 RepID=UPI000B152A9B|nr:DUF6423 family protein [Streptomyces sp. NBRC 110028]
MTTVHENPLLTGALRAKDIQMAATADLERHVLLISGAIDVNTHDIVVTFELPEPGKWQVVKSESNLTDLPWLTWQMTCDEHTRFCADSDAVIVSRQFAKTFMSPDQDRITFYDGEVRPGEAVLKMFTIEAARRRTSVSHSRFVPPPSDVPGASPQRPEQPTQPRPIKQQLEEQIQAIVENGMPPRPAIELYIPVTSIKG